MSIDNTEDVIDSRDVIKRIEELESERDDLKASYTLVKCDDGSFDVLKDDDDEEDGYAYENLGHDGDEANTWDVLYAKVSPYEAEELENLKSLADKAEGSLDWEYGETLIRDSYFKEYAQELAEEIGAIPNGVQWPCRCIDWDKAADELQSDYFSVDFDGVTYWIRR